MSLTCRSYVSLQIRSHPSFHTCAFPVDPICRAFDATVHASDVSADLRSAPIAYDKHSRRRWVELTPAFELYAGCLSDADAEKGSF